jgi:hypothetical protein
MYLPHELVELILRCAPKAAIADPKTCGSKLFCFKSGRTGAVIDDGMYCEAEHHEDGDDWSDFEYSDEDENGLFREDGYWTNDDEDEYGEDEYYHGDNDDELGY